MSNKRTSRQGPALLSVVLFLSLLFLTACDSRGGPAGLGNEEVGKQISELIDGVIKGSDAPLSELQKLHQFEYQVVRLNTDSAPEVIEGALDELGKHRWNCFHVEKQVMVDTEGKKRRVFTFFCKRSSETPLRYVPRSIIGR